MTELSKTPIRLDDVEDQLAALGVSTIRLSKLKGRKREYLIECATVGDFMVALNWLENTKPLLDEFILHPFAKDDQGLRYSAIHWSA